jgi:hypothetical protein
VDTEIGGPVDVDGDVVPGCVRGLSPLRRASLVTAGCEALRKAQGPPFHPGATGEGKTGRVKNVNP